MLSIPMQMMLVALAGWVNESQLAVIEYRRRRFGCFASFKARDGYGSRTTSEGGSPQRGRRSDGAC